MNLVYLCLHSIFLDIGVLRIEWIFSISIFKEKIILTQMQFS